MSYLNSCLFVQAEVTLTDKDFEAKITNGEGWFVKFYVRAFAPRRTRCCRAPDDTCVPHSFVTGAVVRALQAACEYLGGGGRQPGQVWLAHRPQLPGSGRRPSGRSSLAAPSRSPSTWRPSTARSRRTRAARRASAATPPSPSSRAGRRTRSSTRAPATSTRSLRSQRASRRGA